MVCDLYWVVSLKVTLYVPAGRKSAPTPSYRPSAVGAAVEYVELLA
jgi:hypothetical protein